MATDKSKIGSGVLLRADGTEMSASPVAESSMQDEGGYVFLRLAIFVELISGERIKSALSELKLSDSELKKSADIAALMLHECLRNYSMKYNQARQERLSKAKSGQ